MTVPGDAQALGRTVPCPVAVLESVQQEAVRNDVCGSRSVVQFKHATSAQQASLVGLQHNIAGRLVTVELVHRSPHVLLADSMDSTSQPGQDNTDNQLNLSAGQGTHTR